MMKESRKSNGANPPTIVIADDHEIYRRGLTLCLEHAGMNVIDHAATGRQAVNATLKHRPEILILDLAMPELDGLQVLTIVRHMVPETYVIILTALENQSLIKRASELGAEGYFSKGADIDYLIKAIRERGRNNQSSINAKTIRTPTLPEEICLITPKEKEKDTNGQRLTDKETLILSLLSMGIDNQDIAERVSITQNTLKTHLRKIYSKLGVSNRSQAVIWALRNGF